MILELFLERRGGISVFMQRYGGQLDRPVRVVSLRSLMVLSLHAFLILVVVAGLFLRSDVVVAAATLSTSSVGASSRSSMLVPNQIERVMKQFKVPRSAVSLIVQPVDGKPILQLNAATRRNPASVIKLLTTYVALEKLGPAYTWPTEIYLLGSLQNGRLKGDLGIKGYGDPYLVWEDFWKLLRELKRSGLHTIEGDLIIDDTHFSPIRELSGDFDGQSSRLYNTLPNAAMVNFQSVRLQVTPVGRRAQVQMIPPLPNVRIENRLTLVNKPCSGYQRGIRFEIAENSLRNTIRLSGQFPSSCERYGLSRSVLQPSGYLYGLFSLLWQEIGGEFVGNYRRGKIATARVEPFHVWESRSYREVMTAINKFSNNMMTRNLLLTLAAEASGPPALVPQGVAVVKRYLRERGHDIRQLSLVNGAGLSREVATDANLIASVLVDAYQSRYMPEFVASLPLNGIDGTLRRRLRNEGIQGYAHLKTGQIDNVSSLAGYVQAPSGERYVVVLIVNHHKAHRGSGIAIGDAVVRWIHGNSP